MGTMKISDATDEQLETHRRAIVAEQERRRIKANAEKQVTELNAAYLAASGVEPGQAWRQPTGAHDAYPADWSVTHNGKTWVSLTPANVWEPGVSGWREEAQEEAGAPEWVPPTGAHDAYNRGDLVSFQGSLYRSTIDGNVWSPTDYPQGWKKVEGDA
ncbi:hypothetical protein [Brevibacterium luteolum]|uniref:hypothetical protein n=1 Tax=Brevibacterium luteolum TaxID=199591 RepID=UPI003B67BFBB